MLKECWNNKLSPADFEEKLFNSNVSDAERTKEIDELFNYCGQDNEPSLLFLQYLNVIFSRAPQQVAQYYNDPSGVHCSAVLRLILSCGNSFFESFPLTEEFSVNFAVQVLIIIIEDGSVEALKILSESTTFDILIAKAKYIFPDSIRNICNDFPKERFLECFGISVPYPRYLLLQALYAKEISRPVLFSNHEMTRAIIPNISMINTIPTIFKFIDSRTGRQLFMHLISDFLLSPSLLHAYLITNLTPRVYKALETNDMHPELTSEFDAQSVIDMFNWCNDSKHSNDTNTNHPERSNSDYLFLDSQMDSLKNLFTRLPEKVETDQLIETCLQYPALSSSLCERIINSMRMNDFVSLASYCQQILKRHVDFITLLVQQNKYFDFLKELVNILYIIPDDFSFGPCWMTLLTLIRELWGVGYQRFNTEILAFIESQRNPGLRQFLLKLVHCESEQVPMVHSEKGPFNSTIRFFQKLFSYEMTPDKGVTKLNKKPHYAPALLLFCFSNPYQELKNIWKIKPEPLQLNNLLFYHLMIAVDNQPKPWIAGSELPDYEFLLREAPHDISELNFLLANDFDKLLKTIRVSSLVLWDLVCCWRAWAKTFGLPVFVKQLFEQLIWKASHVSYSTDVDFVFQSVAYVMVVICNEEFGMIDEILQNIDAFFDDTFSENIFAEAISRFVLVLICGTTGKWETSFDFLINKCIGFIEDDEHSNKQKLKFALSVIKTSIGNKLLSTRLGNDVEHALQKLREWLTLVEFYSMKASINERESE